MQPGDNLEISFDCWLVMLEFGNHFALHFQMQADTVISKLIYKLKFKRISKIKQCVRH